jgi:hypothetical protein
MAPTARTDAPPSARYNAANPEHVDRLEDIAERTEKDRIYAIRETLRSYQGRRVLWDLLTACGVFSSVFSAEPLAMAFSAGQQDLGHKLQADLLTADESLYDQMAREARARAKQEATVTRAVLARGSEDGSDDEQRGDR